MLALDFTMFAYSILSLKTGFIFKRYAMKQDKKGDVFDGLGSTKNQSNHDSL